MTFIRSPHLRISPAMFQRSFYRTLALAMLTLLGSLHARAQSMRVVLDPAQTEVHWKVTAGIHTIRGTFKLKTGELIFNPKTGIAEGEILVDATTGQTGNAANDRRVQNDVLESNRYPAIFFHPTSLKGDFKADGAQQQVSAEGTFNIHGADHPLSVPVTVQMASGVVTTSAHFMVPYVQWGMKDPSRWYYRVGKQIQIDIAAKGTVKPVG